MEELKNVKCQKCGKAINNDEDICKHGNKTFCKDCVDKIKSENEDRKKLIEYVMKLFDTGDKPSKFILRQISEYKTKFNMTYSGIHYTLYYCHEILHMQFTLEYGIAIVKYRYEEAEEYWTKEHNRYISTMKLANEKIPERKIKYKKNKLKRESLLVNVNNFTKE